MGKLQATILPGGANKDQTQKEGGDCYHISIIVIHFSFRSKLCIIPVET